MVFGVVTRGLFARVTEPVSRANRAIRECSWSILPNIDEAVKKSLTTTLSTEAQIIQGREDDKSQVKDYLKQLQPYSTSLHQCLGINLRRARRRLYPESLRTSSSKILRPNPSGTGQFTLWTSSINSLSPAGLVESR